MIKKVELKADGRQIKQTFKGVYNTTIIQTGNTIQRTTAPVVTTSGTLIYSVRVTEPNEQPVTILSNRLLPQLGDRYIENGVLFPNVYFTEATPRFIGPRGNLYEWEITYQIGGEFSNTGQIGNGTESGTESALLSFSTSMELEDYASAVDLDGQWNCNSIGEFFADPIIFKSGILNLQYQRKEFENPLWKSRDFFQAVNNTPWYSFAAGTVKVADITFNATMYDNRTEYNVDYKLQYRPSGWKVEKANAGLYYNNAGVLERVKNADGSPVENPALLDRNGNILADSSQVIFKAFRVCNEADLHELGLPDPFEL